LVATEAGHHVARPDPGGDALPHPPEHGVALGVAVVVVDLLEVVDVAEQDRERAGAPPGPLDLALELLVPAPTVGQTGQTVLTAEPLQLPQELARPLLRPLERGPGAELAPRQPMAVGLTEH